jgi:hypothetical protein
MMKLERNAKMYGLVFSAVALILLLLTGLTIRAHRRQQLRYNYQLMNLAASPLPYVGWRGYQDKDVRRHIYLANDNLSDVEVLSLLKIRQYGLPIDVLASFNLRGELQYVRYLPSHLPRDFFEEDIIGLYQGDVQDSWVKEVPLIAALKRASELAAKVSLSELRLMAEEASRER